MFRYMKFLSISVSHGNSEADSLCGEKAPRGSAQRTKTEGAHYESGKPNAQGKFLLAGINISGYLTFKIPSLCFHSCHLCAAFWFIHEPEQPLRYP